MPPTAVDRTSFPESVANARPTNRKPEQLNAHRPTPARQAAHRGDAVRSSPDSRSCSGPGPAGRTSAI